MLNDHVTTKHVLGWRLESEQFVTCNHSYNAKRKETTLKS